MKKDIEHELKKVNNWQEISFGHLAAVSEVLQALDLGELNKTIMDRVLELRKPYQTYKVFSDIEDHGPGRSGEIFTVYNHLNKYVGSYLPGDPYITRLLNIGVKIRDGIDWRQ